MTVWAFLDTPRAIRGLWRFKVDHIEEVKRIAEAMIGSYSAQGVANYLAAVAILQKAGEL